MIISYDSFTTYLQVHFKLTAQVINRILRKEFGLYGYYNVTTEKIDQNI